MSVTTHSSFGPYFFSRARYILVRFDRRDFARANKFGELRRGGEREFLDRVEFRDLLFGAA